MYTTECNYYPQSTGHYLIGVAAESILFPSLWHLMCTTQCYYYPQSTGHYLIGMAAESIVLPSLWGTLCFTTECNYYPQSTGHYLTGVAAESTILLYGIIMYSVTNNNLYLIIIVFIYTLIRYILYSDNNQLSEALIYYPNSSDHHVIGMTVESTVVDRAPHCTTQCYYYLHMTDHYVTAGRRVSDWDRSFTTLTRYAAFICQCEYLLRQYRVVIVVTNSIIWTTIK